MKIVVPTEVAAGELRVALLPDGAARLVAAGHTVIVQSGAGVNAGASDNAYEAAGASVMKDRAQLLAAGEVIVTVSGVGDADTIPAGTTLVGQIKPLSSSAIPSLAERGIHSIAMELVPRITRAQKMDSLSSQATVAGYKAVLLAAERHGRFFPMLMTAAGTIPPARVLVLGVGVAGLQAIATARRLGAVVQGFDVRPAVREQVESLGATWVGVESQEAEGAGGYAKEVSDDMKQRQQEHLRKLVADADVVITTAQIPGRPAPVLITEDMLTGMKAGSIIVDLAAESGGNCEATNGNDDVVRGGVTILGRKDLAALTPIHASYMYSRNIEAILGHIAKDGALHLDREDEITRECLVTHGGEVVHTRVSERLLQPR